MHKGLVCDGKRYLTSLALESQSTTFNYQWLCLVVDIKMSASRSVTSGSLPLVMSLAVHSSPPPTSVLWWRSVYLDAFQKHVWHPRWKENHLRLRGQLDGWTLFLRIFWRLGESGSVFLARKEMQRAVYTSKGREPFFYHQCTLSWLSGPGISLSERAMNGRAGEYHVFPRCPCFCW